MHRRLLLFGAIAGLALAGSLVTSAEADTIDLTPGFYVDTGQMSAHDGDLTFNLDFARFDAGPAHEAVVYAAMQPENNAGTKIDQRAATAGQPGDLKAARPSSDTGREVPGARTVNAGKQSWLGVSTGLPPRPS